MSASASATSGTAPPVPEFERSQSQSIAAVERAMDVLLLFNDLAGAELGVTEISARLAMPKAAVHRILTSLRSRDLVCLDPSTRRYSLGPATVRLSWSYLKNLDVLKLAAPGLAQLSRETNETATLSILKGGGRMYLDQVLPVREIRMAVTLGEIYPLHAGSSSKSILAFMTDQEIQDYLARTLEPLTDKTITNVAALTRELTRVRAQGYATSRGERQAGSASIAAPIFDHEEHPTAAISVCGPAERFKPDGFVDLLLKIARAVSGRIGYQPPNSGATNRERKI